MRDFSPQCAQVDLICANHVRLLGWGRRPSLREKLRVRACSLRVLHLGLGCVCHCRSQRFGKKFAG